MTKSAPEVLLPLAGEGGAKRRMRMGSRSGNARAENQEHHPHQPVGSLSRQRERHSFVGFRAGIPVLAGWGLRGNPFPAGGRRWREASDEGGKSKRKCKSGKSRTPPSPACRQPLPPAGEAFLRGISRGNSCPGWLGTSRKSFSRWREKQPMTKSAPEVLLPLAGEGEEVLVCRQREWEKKCWSAANGRRQRSVGLPQAGEERSGGDTAGHGLAPSRGLPPCAGTGSPDFHKTVSVDAKLGR